MDVYKHIYIYALSHRMAKSSVWRATPPRTPCGCSQTVYNTKGTRAHTHRELIRKWLWEPKGSSRRQDEYMYIYTCSLYIYIHIKTFILKCLGSAGGIGTAHRGPGHPMRERIYMYFYIHTHIYK